MDPFEKLRQLTAREREVLSLYAQGIKYEDIGKQLNVTENTVRAHVSHIYEKLQLYHLPRRARLVAIVQDYAPLLDQLDDSESESTKDLEIITPPTPEQEETIDEDAKSIRALQVVEQPEPPKRGPGCLTRIGRLIRNVLILLVLLVLAAVGGAAAIGWDETQDILADFFPQIFVAQGDTDNRQTPTDLPSPVVQVATEAPATLTPTTAPTLTFTPAPTQTPMPTPTYDFGQIYEVNEWHKQGDLWIRLSEYEVRTNGWVLLVLEVWNQTPDEIIISWVSKQNYSLRDNLGYDYPEGRTDIQYNQYAKTFEPGEFDKISRSGVGYTGLYSDEVVLTPDVTELYFTITDLSRFDKVTWIIRLSK